MRVVVTLDYYDGSQGKAVEIDAEELPTRELLLRMTSRDVCGFTVTKLKDITRAVEIMEGTQQE